MVVAAPLPVARRPPAADVAVRHRLGISGQRAHAFAHRAWAGNRGERGLDHGLEPPAHEPVIGQEVVHAIGIGAEILARRHDVHVLRPHSLDGLEQVRIKANLQHRAPLRLAGELRVPYFVRPASQTARTRHAAQHVRPPRPASVEESGLHDHFDPLAHRGQRALERGLLVGLSPEPRDAEVLPLEVAHERDLVVTSALAENRDVGSEPVGRAA